MAGTGGRAQLTLAELKRAARLYLSELSAAPIGALFGVTDGKAVGTHVEAGFNEYLFERYDYKVGNAASGIDFPDLKVDLKVTSLRQPQSSTPFRSAREKVYGLGYGLLVCVYEKRDDPAIQAARLDFRHAIYVGPEATGDFQTTCGLREMLGLDANRDDVVAYLEDRNLPLDEVGRIQLAEEILRDPPRQGYLTMSNALQWRLQYTRAIALGAAGETAGIENLLA